MFEERIVPVPTFECQYYIWTSKIREAIPKIKTHALFFMWIFDNKHLWFGSVAQKTVILDYQEKQGLCVVVVFLLVCLWSYMYLNNAYVCAFE